MTQAVSHQRPEGADSHDPPRRAYMPGLDGIRAIAVSAVLLFHSGFDWAVGGWLGVSVFFTLSGYLITSGLIVEHRHAGTISVISFWERRVRRLLPATVLTLTFVSLLGDRLVFEDQIESLRGELISALFYVANWHSYLSDAAYSDIFGAPSPVRHFWSLSIEEQFYLIFPIVFLLASRFAKPVMIRRVFVVLTLASLTTTLMLTDVTRTYYGTDTRVLEILAGVLLAFWHSDHPGAEHNRWLHRLAWPAWAVVIVAMTRVQSFDPSVGTWLLPTFAVLSVVLTFSSIAPRGVLKSVLEARPVAYLGRISYGVYLFHWPIYSLLTAHRVGATGLKLFAARAGLTLVVAALSYSLIEMPIRRRRRTHGGRVLAGVVALSLASVTLVAFATLRVTAEADPAAATVDEQDPAITSPTTASEGAPEQTPDSTIAPVIPAKILVLGDSTARSVAEGLTAWGDESGLAVVDAIGLPGCGVIDLGLFRHQPGPGGEVQVECMNWPNDWPEIIESFQPDLIAVFYGPMDTMDRDVDRDGSYESPGDAVHDAAYATAFAAKIDALSEAGIPVIWATPPYVWADSPRGSGNRSLTTMPDRVDALTALLRKLVAADGRVDLFEYGRRVDGGDSEVDFDVRPDGVHMSEKQAASAAEDWLLEMMLDAGR